MINIKKIVTGKWRENCYIVCHKNKNALIIDPGSNVGDIIQYIEKNNLKILAIFNTHTHYDHIGGVNDLKEKYQIPFFIHSKDEKLLKSANLYRILFDGDEPIKIPLVDYYFDRIESPIEIGGFTIHVLFAPGHTEGSVCLRIEESLFSGDTLLKNNIGRIDLPGGDRLSLIKSLNMISKLPKELEIFPGHGKITTLDDELKNNRKFIKVVK